MSTPPPTKIPRSAPAILAVCYFSCQNTDHHLVLDVRHHDLRRHDSRWPYRLFNTIYLRKPAIVWKIVRRFRDYFGDRSALLSDIYIVSVVKLSHPDWRYRWSEIPLTTTRAEQAPTHIPDVDAVQSMWILDRPLDAPGHGAHFGLCSIWQPQGSQHHSLFGRPRAVCTEGDSARPLRKPAGYRFQQGIW